MQPLKVDGALLVVGDIFHAPLHVVVLHVVTACTGSLVDATFIASGLATIACVVCPDRVESAGGCTGIREPGTPAARLARPPPADPSPGLLLPLAAFTMVECFGSAPLHVWVYVCVYARVRGTDGTRVSAVGMPHGSCSNRTPRRA